jgi:hypothetical protein
MVFRWLVFDDGVGVDISDSPGGRRDTGEGGEFFHLHPGGFRVVESDESHDT